MWGEADWEVTTDLGSYRGVDPNLHPSDSVPRPVHVSGSSGHVLCSCDFG